MRRVAVIGSGIAGLAVARGLAGHASVTLFEADRRFGGHAHTVDMTLDGISHGVDTGFLVLNERTYPALRKLLAELDVATAPAEMSFSVQVPGRGGIEWSGNDLASVFAQRRNAVRPAFWRMLADILRFNRLGTALARGAADALSLDEPIDSFLDRHRFSAAFRDWYFLPMIGSIWSCPVDQMLRFPVATMVRFCHNHGLLQIADRPQWHTVRGGSRRYVEAMLRAIPDARAGTPVRRMVRHADGVTLATDAGTERFDEAVLACHSDQSLALLADASAEERATLGAVRYQANRAVLHTDSALLPVRRIAWAAWNYERATDRPEAPSVRRPPPEGDEQSGKATFAHGLARERAGVCLHYLINRLQPLPFNRPVIVSLNPVREPRPETVHAAFDYAHPVFDRAAIQAQDRLPALQGTRRTWFCGAWTRHGFHEDGLTSGLAVCEALKARLANTPWAEATAA